MQKVLLLIGIFNAALLNSNCCIAQPDKQLKGFSVPAKQAGKTLLNEMQSDNGAPIMSLNTIAVTSDFWVNNLDDLVGRIVKVQSNPDGSSSFDIMVRIVNDKDSLRVKLAPIGDEEHTLIKNNMVASFSFMGIGANLSKEELYEYNSTCTGTCVATDKQLDKAKVPSNALCNGTDNCQFFYINGASVRLSETTRYKKVGKKVKITELSGFGIAKPLEGEIAIVSENNEHVKKYVIFCSLLRIPK